MRRALCLLHGGGRNSNRFRARTGLYANDAVLDEGTDRADHQRIRFYIFDRGAYGSRRTNVNRCLDFLKLL